MSLVAPAKGEPHIYDVQKSFVCFDTPSLSDFYVVKVCKILGFSTLPCTDAGVIQGNPKCARVWYSALIQTGCRSTHGRKVQNALQNIRNVKILPTSKSICYNRTLWNSTTKLLMNKIVKLPPLQFLRAF